MISGCVGKRGEGKEKRDRERELGAWVGGGEEGEREEGIVVSCL